MASSSSLASVIAYFDGPSDERRVAGLLLAARYLEGAGAEEAPQAAASFAQALVGSKFLERLLGSSSSFDEEEASWELSDAQRAGVSVATQLARLDGGAAISAVALRPVAGAVEAAFDARARGDDANLDDLAACLDCVLALQSGVPDVAHVHSGVLARLAADLELPEAVWTSAVEVLGAVVARGLVLGPRDVDALVAAARSALSRELPLLEIVAATFVRRTRAELASTEAQASRRAAYDAVAESIPRLLLRGGTSETARDTALRLAVVVARSGDWLARKSGAPLRLVARIAAAEARLALDEALALLDDPVDRLERRVSLCLGFLETVVDALVADDDDDAETTLAAAASPDVLLDVKAALSDASEAALAFVSEVRQSHVDSNAALDLCRDCFRFLGRVALDFDDDGHPDSIHARLANLQPFVADLMARDRRPTQDDDVPRSTTVREIDLPDSDDEDE